MLDGWSERLSPPKQLNEDWSHVSRSGVKHGKTQQHHSHHSINSSPPRWTTNCWSKSPRTSQCQRVIGPPAATHDAQPPLTMLLDPTGSNRVIQDDECTSDMISFMEKQWQTWTSDIWIDLLNKKSINVQTLDCYTESWPGWLDPTCLPTTRPCGSILILGICARKFFCAQELHNFIGESYPMTYWSVCPLFAHSHLLVPLHWNEVVWSKFCIQLQTYLYWCMYIINMQYMI